MRVIAKLEFLKRNVTFAVSKRNELKKILVNFSKICDSSLIEVNCVESGSFNTHCAEHSAKTALVENKTKNFQVDT